jgi:type II secretory pathway pseudopilin PulG
MRTRPSTSAFTLIEIITAMAVIVTLTGLVLSISSLFMRDTSSRRALGEIAALSAACEGYKADHGAYPQERLPDFRRGVTERLDPRQDFIPTKAKYEEAGMFLYRELTGDRKGKSGEVPDGIPDQNERCYLKDIDSKMVKMGETKVYFQDPFGYAYGYSTAAALVEQKFQQELKANGASATRGEPEGFNGASFDLWSTGGSRPGSDPTEQKKKELEWAKWIKNW